MADLGGNRQPWQTATMADSAPTIGDLSPAVADPAPTNTDPAPIITDLTPTNPTPIITDLTLVVVDPALTNADPTLTVVDLASTNTYTTPDVADLARSDLLICYTRRAKAGARRSMEPAATSSKKRLRVCRYNGTATEPRQVLPIPFDLRLDVLSRLDVASLLRYAAASKSTRRDILSQDFRRSWALRAEASRGFDPALLLGFSYRLPVRVRAATAGERVAQTTSPQHFPRFDAILLDSFDAVASRDGLVVLLRRPTGFSERWDDVLSRVDLRVCNSLTGQVSRIPPADVREAYPHALLAVGGAGRSFSFQLLAADSDLRTQTFSSEDGRWGAVVEPRHAAHLPYIPPSYASGAMVLGPTVYWLCRLKRQELYGQPPAPNPPCIISLDTSSSQASRIELPPGCLDRLRMAQNVFDALMLAPSPDRRLSVLAAETCVISMWTLSEGDNSSMPAARWTRQVVIRRHSIEHEPGPAYSVQLMGLGERSGTVVLQMDGIGLVQLNLGSGEAAVVRRDELFKGGFWNYNPGRCQLCLHEIHLTALLQAMKPF